MLSVGRPDERRPGVDAPVAFILSVRNASSLAPVAQAPGGKTIWKRIVAALKAAWDAPGPVRAHGCRARLTLTLRPLTTDPGVSYAAAIPTSSIPS